VGRQFLKNGAILIALVIVGGHLTGWGGLMIDAGKAGSGLVRAFQGAKG